MPRLDVAVIDRDGAARVVNAGRPATLVAFEDAHEGKMMPETFREISWVVHHALAIEEPLNEWLDTLEVVSAQPEDVALARSIIGGDVRARKIALGELPPEEPEEPEEPVQEDDELGPPDPAAAQLEEVAAGGRS